MTDDNNIHDFMSGVKQLRKFIGLHHFVVGFDAAYLLHTGEPITRKTVVDVFVPHDHPMVASIQEASYGKYKAKKKVEYVDGWTFRLTAPFIIPELKWSCPEKRLEHSRRLFCFTRGHEVKIVQHLTAVGSSGAERYKKKGGIETTLRLSKSKDLADFYCSLGTPDGNQKADRLRECETYKNSKFIAELESAPSFP